MEPCSIWDDVEVGPTNIRVTPLKHTHLDFGSARSNRLIQFDVKFICDQPVEGAIDVLSPEFSIWGRFYVQSVLGKHINYCLQMCFNTKYNFKGVLPEVQTLCHCLHDPGLPPPVAPVHCCVRERGQVEAGCSGEKKTYLSTFLWRKLTSMYALQGRPVVQRRNL